jgi:hypothetical protein
MENENTLTCKKNIIDQETFDREITLCKILHKNNNLKCSWGKCEHCGVIPLLYKLHKGQLIEDPKELSKLKNDILK